ncbi:MAG: haloacid dehalogenase-like hydrolase [Gemmatimonadota bacterium]|nr:haloacid dehalogenase-like hydrolase [Gemmatimonadota bacterium]
MADLRRLVLFDIDGTLLSAGGAPRRAFRSALVEYFDTEGGAATDRFAGKTDPQILHDLMLAEGFDADHVDERMDAFFAHYLTRLEAELEIETGHRLYPGVEALVTALAEDPATLLGLVTGNIEAGARIKLAHFGLWERFEVGAYGSDDPVRDHLPPIAVDRAEERTGRRFSGDEVVVVGDTPADIACARAAGARVVAVATGVHGAEELADHDPDLLVDTLEDPALLEELGVEPVRATRSSSDGPPSP